MIGIGTTDPTDVAGRRVLVVSPHYDDVPLSLGQSLLDGELSKAHVDVKVIFGRSNWSVAVHPTRKRAPLITAWRRLEETAAAVRFGYRVRAEALEEVILRTGELDPASFRETGDPSELPEVAQVAAMLWAWSTEFDIMWLPAGLGRHVDHQLVALAGAGLVEAGAPSIAFYEDRPYAAWLSDGELEEQLGELGIELEPRLVSGPITDVPQRWVRRIYRSQMDEYFMHAQDFDRESRRPERVWVPVRDSDPVRSD